MTNVINLFSKKSRTTLAVLAVPVVIYFGAQGFNKDEVSFNEDVRPIINSKCISCHGGVKKSGGFSLLFREEALGNTKSGKPAIIPGDPGNSELMKRITSHDPDIRMPYNKDPLSKAEIDIFRRWIDQGAEWEDHWAFLKPKSINPPDYGGQEFVKNDIDRFILEKLEENGLGHSPEADKRTLIRRVSLDLTGLPPTEKEVENFLNDHSRDAYEKVVDRLLKSPAYGERWTAMWLDLARFADSRGYEKDSHRNIWRYRDYLIRSFNDDKPYDKFTIEQLAGDLLPNASEDQIIATAFHRNTMNNDEGGTDNEEFRTAGVIDRVNTTFDVWQGLTLSCVQCHTHPYDPIKHEEYYNFMAFFNNTRDNDLDDESPTLLVENDYDTANASKIISYIAELSGDRTDVPESFREKRKKYLPGLIISKDFDESHNIELVHPSVIFMGFNSFVCYDNINLTGVKTIGLSYTSEKEGIVEVRLDKINGPLLTLINLPFTFNNTGNTKAQIKTPVNGIHKVYLILRPNRKGVGDLRLREVQLLPDKKNVKFSSKDSILNSERAKLAKILNPAGTPVMEELQGSKRRSTHVFLRGNWMTKGKKVEPAVPKSLNPMPQDEPSNRLGMAKWMVSEDNPLTARVAVNRFWEQLFGFGIVETLEDFGSQGIKPTHPELLDWLAIKFMDDYKWSMKKILKLMVMSGTYRQSSHITPEHLEKDAANKFLARGPRLRLTAEQIRDQALAVGGLLSSKMYGPSVMPYQPPGLWQTVYNGMDWKISKGEDQHRRAVYTYIKRTSPYPNMLNFDSPSREFCMVRRIRTNTPLQSLALLNDTVYTEAAVGLAKRMIKAGGKNINERIKAGYKIALARNPDQKTMNKLLEFYHKAASFYRKDASKAGIMAGQQEDAREIAPLALVASAIINLDEFITKE